MNRLSGLQLPVGTADFRLHDRHVVDTIVAFPERRKFLRGLAAWTGFQAATVEYRVGARYAGEAKYSFTKLARLAWDGITSYPAAPLCMAFYLGPGIFGLSAAYGMFSIVAHLLGHTPPGWTSVVVSVLAIGGLQMIFMGLTGECLAGVFDEGTGRPNGLLKTSGASRRARPTVPDTD